jgi:monoamine oxidase
MSSEWFSRACGYMEGALLSGEGVADEVHAALARE